MFTEELPYQIGKGVTTPDENKQEQNLQRESITIAGELWQSQCKTERQRYIDNSKNKFPAVEV